MRKARVGIVGATGAVGRMMVSILESRDFPLSTLRLFASERSRGLSIPFRGKPVPVEVLGPGSFDRDLDILLFSAGGGTSLEYAPVAAGKGIFVVDNSSAWRMDQAVPLVVPEVNPEALSPEKKIIANPNCSTIQMVCALAPLHRAAGLERVFVATYQSVSGAGQKGIADLERQVSRAPGDPVPPPAHFQHPIAFNLIPQIDQFLPGGYTREEIKMVNETRKILGDESIRITATCVRVPVYVSHSEAVTVDLREDLSPDRAAALLAAAPGVELVDDPGLGRYPMPLDAAGRDEVFVGRLRRDISGDKSLSFWVVSDNLRKGAALNAVQVAERLLDFIP